MDITSELIFFFSALGACNGFILTLYFFRIATKKRFSNYFLAFLMLALSIRILKSVFFFFNPQLSNVFIQIGLSACVVIGPFLYLYLRSYAVQKKVGWPIHIFPYLTAITALGFFYPYVEHSHVWSRWIIMGIYLQWLSYLIVSFKYIRSIFKQRLKEKKKFSGIQIWLLNIYFGTCIIWLAYNIGTYGSYIVGALSFSFVLYLIGLLFVFRSRKTIPFFEFKEKYPHKRLESETLQYLQNRLALLTEEELFLNPNLTLNETANLLEVSAHTLSQFLNEHLGKSFVTFINELRINKAKELLLTNNKYTVESLGYESGFNSKSTFFTTFKKMTGQTPKEYRKHHGFSSTL